MLWFAVARVFNLAPTPPTVHTIVTLCNSSSFTAHTIWFVDARLKWAIRYSTVHPTWFVDAGLRWATYMYMLLLNSFIITNNQLQYHFQRDQTMIKFKLQLKIATSVWSTHRVSWPSWPTFLYIINKVGTKDSLCTLQIILIWIWSNGMGTCESFIYNFSLSPKREPLKV